MEAALDLLVRDCRGEERGTLREMALRWMWTKDAVYRFLRDKPCDGLCNGKHDDSKEVADAAATARATARATAKAELEWRVDEVWSAYCRTRRRWLEIVGEEPEDNGSAPKCGKAMRQYIRQSLRVHDVDLLGPEQRERWSKESVVKKSGMGIFCDAWMVGEAPGNDRRAGGKAWCLEPERAWKPLKGSDPVHRFSAAYDKRKRQER